jgi:hypothetical protein
VIHPERGHLALLPSSQPAARRVLLDVERTLRGRPPIRPIVCAQAVCCEEAALVRLDLCVVSDDLALDRIARRSRGSERERTEQQERCAAHGPHLTGARVASLAGPGEVLVSSTVKDLVAGSGLRFRKRGVHELKGIPGAWQLYSVEST